MRSAVVRIPAVLRQSPLSQHGVADNRLFGKDRARSAAKSWRYGDRVVPIFIERGPPIHQGVGEPGRPCLPWKQETGGSNPAALTILMSKVALNRICSKFLFDA
jgi:hypothetical protein